MAVSAFLSSSFSSHSSWTYDVFLSFRGKDTRKNFTDHLYFALRDAGVNTFRDDNELRRGEDLASELLSAIEGSKISVIVFSRNYAESRWCLEELVKIMECRRTERQLVLPIFYDVEPSDVRHQTGSFAQAFLKHEERSLLDMDKVIKWRRALFEAANLSGWDLRNTADGHEAKFIRKIVEAVSRELNNTYLYVTLYQVGVDSRVQDITLLLRVGADDVRMVGIWGMGGIGKTTISKAIYNKLFHSFEGKSFLPNIRETSKQPDGLVRLQKQLLSDILKMDKTKVNSVDTGIATIQERLRHKRVLVILDDVDQLEQLNAIARSRDWFGSRSRIIITTRDEQLLKMLEVDAVYTTKEMSEIESLELFSWHAFRKSSPTEDYLDLSRSIVAYSRGLPLALEVLGSFLFSRSIQEWESTLEKLKRIPHDQIQKKLRISFDSLSDSTLKDIFLDISCFFIGMDKNYVIQILNACGFFAKIGISILIQRCLLSVGNRNKLIMHDLLRDMGREIVREKFPKIPGKCSRLWLHKDALDILAKHELFEELKFLNLSHSHYLTRTPNFARLPNLEKLILKNCTSLLEIHQSIRDLNNLILVNLKDCRSLESLPRSFYKLKSLQTLILSGCSKFDNLADELGEMESLTTFLADNTAIRQVPHTIVQLKKLKCLHLCGCKGSPSKSLPSLLWSWISPTPRKSPKSINLLPASLQGLNALRELSLRDCNLSDDAIPKDLGSLCSLEYLDLQNNHFRSLPSSLGGLSKLQTLILDNCTKLQSIPDLPPNLSQMWASYCMALERMPNISNISNLDVLFLNNCNKLVEIPGLDKLLKSILEIRTTGCSSLTNTFKQSILQEWTTSEFGKVLEISLPGNDIPDWFKYKDEGPSVSFEVPRIIRGFILCFVYSLCPDKMVDLDTDYVNLYTTVINYTNTTEGRKPETRSLHITHDVEDHIWQGNFSKRWFDMEAGDQVKVIVDCGPGVNVKKTGVFLLDEKIVDGNMIHDASTSNKDAIVVSNDGDAFMDQNAIGSKRGLGDDKSESSHGCFDDDREAKRLRCDHDTEMSIDDD